MLKKYTAILMMSIAYAILLGHSIIPHHHHDYDEDLTEHHHTEHHHDSDVDTEGINHLFSHFTHSADVVNFTTSHNTAKTIVKQQLSVFSVLPDNLLLSKFIILTLLFKPPAEHFNYISPHSLFSGLRAPPTFIG